MRTTLIFALGLSVGFAGCSGADENPLGGPYGDGTDSSGSSSGSGSSGGSSGGKVGSGGSSSSSGGATGSSSGRGSGGGNGGSSSSSGSGGASSSSSGGGNGGSSSSSSSGGNGGSSSSSSGGGNGGSSSSSSGGGSGSSSGGASAPTWSSLWTQYLKANVQTGCVTGGNCHSECSTASGCYNFLQQQGYIDGSTSPPLVNSGSCLTWFGGKMPRNGAGKNDQTIASQFTAWAKAGAQDN